jgi:WD40 repeat protein
MDAAGRALGGDDFAEARRLLQKWRPATKEDADYRAWEWHFLDAQCREVGLCLRGHDSPVQAVAWGPGGDKLASADRQGIVKVWSVATGKNQPEDTMKAPAAVLALGWSPDGKLAVACHPTVQVWEPGSGRAARTLPDPDKSPVPTRLLSGGLAGGAKLTLLDTWMTSVAWSPDSRKLALVDANGKVKAWDIKADDEAPLLGTHEGGAHSLVWNPSGTRLASVGGDGVVKVWDPAKRKGPLAIHSACKLQRVWVTISFALTWSNDGRYLKVVSAEGEVHVLEANSGKEVSVRPLERRDALALPMPVVTSLSRFVWAPTGKLLASIVPAFGPFSGASDVKIWDVETRREVLSFPAAWSIAKPQLQGDRNDEATGCAPAFDGSGRRLAVGTDKGIVRTWDVGPGRRAVRSLLLNPFATACTWSADSRHIFCTTEITLDDIRGVHKKHRDWEDARNRQPGPGLPPPPPGPAFPPAPGQPPVAAEVQNPRPRIQVFDAITGAVTYTWDTKDKHKLDKLAASPDGKWLAGASGDGLLQLWQAKGGGSPRTLEAPPKTASAGPRMPPPGPPVPNKTPGEGLVLCWAPDGKLLAHATGGRPAIHLWDPNTGKVVRTLKGQEKPLRSLAWSPDKEGKLLASADDDGTVTVWDVASGKPALSFKYTVLRQPPAFPFGSKPFASSVLSWSPDGKRLAVASEDETIKIWDADKKEELATLHGNPVKENHSVVCAVAWSPDGRRLAAASPDGTFLLWDTDTRQRVLTLRPVPTGIIIPGLLPSHAGTLAWSPDGTQLALFGGGGGVTIWDATPKAADAGR